MRILWLLGIALSCWAIPLQSQEYDWWNDLHGWDGTTHWSTYLTYSPQFMGPNALPIPPIKNGKISDGYIRLDFSAKHITGEQTLDLNIDAFYEVVADRVGIHAYGIVYERYDFDASIRDARKARDFDGTGYGSGDLYLGTWIRIGPENTNWNVVSSFTIKTASGSNREAARFTDSPGYFMDLSAGRTFMISNWELHLFGMLGFYAWQTNEDVNPQNDALIYGMGIEAKIHSIGLSTSLGGYSGYKNNGDQPIIIRNNLHYKLNQKNFLEIGFDIGLRDFRYTTARLSVGRTFNN